MLKKIVIALFKLRAKIIITANKWLLKKSFAAAEKKAQVLKEKYGVKVWIFLWEKDYVAMAKSDFKRMWNVTPKLKQRTIQQWQNFVHEY